MSKRDNLWADIVRLTDEPGREKIRALRIALFILLSGSGNDPLMRQIVRLLRSVGCLFRVGGTAFARAERGRLLFCCAHRTPSNMETLLPVAREAYRRGVLGGIVSAGDFSKELAEFVGCVPIVTADSLVSRLGFRERVRIAGEALTTFRGVWRMLVQYDGRLAARFRRHAGTALEGIVLSSRMAKGFGMLLDAWSPSFIVSTSDLWPLEYQLVHQAARMQIPSIVIQHGTITHYYWPFTASLFAAWGQESFEEMRSHGAPAARLVVGGMPAVDKVFRTVRTNESETQTRTGPAVCVVLSQTNGAYLEPEVFADYRRFLSALVPRTPFVRWRIKLHPSEDGSFYDSFDPEVKARLEFYPSSTGLEEALREADVVTTLFSTAGIQAMAAGKPLIIPVVSPRMTTPGLLPQVRGAIMVHTPEQFEKELESLVSNAGYRARKLKSQGDALDGCLAYRGCASEAILDLIESRLKAGNAPMP